MACYLRNTQNMVKVLFTIIFTYLSLVCIAQDKSLATKIELHASLNRNEVYFGDSLELILNYRNISDDTLWLYPKATIGLGRTEKAFITYDKPERIAYIINFFTSYDSLVNLKPGEEFYYTFNIKADSNFFYKGENEVCVYYHLFDNPQLWKRKKTDKRRPVLSLYSAPIKINVYSKDRSLQSDTSICR